MRFPSNPVQGIDGRSVQVAQQPAGWKSTDTSFEGQAVCGRCHGVCHDFILKSDFGGTLNASNVPILPDVVLSSKPIRNYDVESQLYTEAVQNNTVHLLDPINLPQNHGPQLTYRRCHWSSRRDIKDVPLGQDPQAEVETMDLQWFLFYGLADPANTWPSEVPSSPDEIGLVFSPPALKVSNAISSLLALDEPGQWNYNLYGDSDVFGFGNLTNVNFGVKGWCLVLLVRYYETSDDPEAFPWSVTFRPVLAYELTSGLFNCHATSNWAVKFNPTGIPSHTMQTVPFQP